MKYNCYLKVEKFDSFQGGGTVSIDDADSNPTMRSLSLNGSNLSISSSNSVNLSSVINSIWKLNGSTALL